MLEQSYRSESKNLEISEAMVVAQLEAWLLPTIRHVLTKIFCA